MKVGSPAMVALSMLCLLVFLELVVASNNPFYTNSRYGKRVPGPATQRWLVASNNSFYVNSRYGKRISDEPEPPSSVARIWGASRRRNNLEPRTDKFFLNSRYGKRAHGPVNNHVEPDGLLTHLLSETEDSSVETTDLKCRYTGVHDLYRCVGPARKENSSAGNGGGSNVSSSSTSSEESQILNN